MGHDIINKYNRKDFLCCIIKILQEIACILCGQIHKIQVHQRFIRYVRSEVTEGNIGITIFSIFCRFARAAGKQYTKRILPWFVIPECNICLVNVLEFYRLSSAAGRIQYTIAAAVLGTVCVSTIRRHYNMAAQYISRSSLIITCFPATLPSLSELDDFVPSGRGDLEELTHQAGRIDKATRKAGIPVTGKISPVRIVHWTYALEKTRKTIHFPMNLNVCRLLYYDTS